MRSQRSQPATVSELRLDAAGEVFAWITCPPAAVPAPGQYLLAYAAEDADSALATAVFAAGTAPDGFLAAPPLPRSWAPGTELVLRGPLGHGFHLPATARRLALAACAGTPARLLGLAAAALENDLAVALYTGSPVPQLPVSAEVYPLSALPEAASWADLMAIDLPLRELSRLSTYLGARSLPCPAQVLVYTSMPCGGVAECGVCAVPSRRRWKLACSDGPVFDLNDLDWRED